MLLELVSLHGGCYKQALGLGRDNLFLEDKISKIYPTKNDWPSWIAITKHGIDLYNLQRWIVHSTNLNE